MKILAIYDNGGKTADRYTVYFDFVKCTKEGKTFYLCLYMTEHAYYGRSSGMLGRHNGKRITLEQLPLDCQIETYNNLTP